MTARRPTPRIIAIPDLARSAFFRSNAAQGRPSQPLKDDQRPVAKQLARFLLFARVPAILLRELASGANLQTYRQGEFLWQRGDSATTVVLIESGLVKASRCDSRGVTRSYGLFGPGDSMGLYAFWAGMVYPTDAVALNDGLRLIAIDASELSRAAEQHPRLSANLKGEVTRFSEAFINKIEVISAGTVPQRLAMLMLQLVDRYGVDRRSGQARLPISLTLEQFSEIVDARIETIARCLARWKHEGWIVTNVNGWQLSDLDKFKDVLEHGSGRRR